MTPEIEQLYQEIIHCQKCILSRSRRNAVPGEGPQGAQMMFIGEGPGFHEDQQGRPFVGPAGQFLEELLASIGFGREQVYICNVIKCRPPGNRDPLPEEIEACRPYLDRQLSLIKPKVVVTLGRFSMARFFPRAKISEIHGRPRKMEGIIYYPIYHPAAALHQPRWRPVVEEEFKRIPELLAQMERLPDEGPRENAEQLSFF
jgi:DNA polymerase